MLDSPCLLPNDGFRTVPLLFEYRVPLAIDVLAIAEGVVAVRALVNEPESLTEGDQVVVDRVYRRDTVESEIREAVLDEVCTRLRRVAVTPRFGVEPRTEVRPPAPVVDRCELSRSHRFVGVVTLLRNDEGLTVSGSASYCS